MMRVITTLAWCLTVVLLTFAMKQVRSAELPGEGKEKEAVPAMVPSTAEEPVIDGRLDEGVWSSAGRFELSYEIDPGENLPAKVKTEVFIVYSESALYVGFKCYDPSPADIRAHLSDRDNDYGDDFVAIVLDTFNDQRRAYILWANPFGVQEDAIMTDDDYIVSWDTLYESEGCIQDWGWSLEMKIPFSSLKFQRSDEPQTWGFNAYRNYPRTISYTFSHARIVRGNNSELSQFAKIQGFENVSPGRNVELIHTVTMYRTQDKPDFPEGELRTSEEKVEYGMTSKWGITTNLTMSATFNPDFSQVEADAMQLDVNRLYALYYDEKRPFFTEGADFFETPINYLVYTRSFNDPDWGLKLTGKEGDHSFGAIFLEDAVTNLLLPGNQGSRSVSMAQPATTALARYTNDIGSNYTLGTLVSNREGDGYYNRMLGFDGRFRFSDNHLLTAQVVGTNTQYPTDIAGRFGQSDEPIDDLAVDLFYRLSTRQFYLVLAYKDIGEDFRADTGFIPRVGYSRSRVQADYRWLGKPGSWWRLFLVLGGVIHDEMQDGVLLFDDTYGGFLYRGALHSGLDFFVDHYKQHYSGMEYDYYVGNLDAWIKPWSNLSLNVSTKFGEDVDYTNNRLGDVVFCSTQVEYTPGNHLKLAVGHDYEKMEVEGSDLYTANILQMTLIYQFNKRMFLRGIFQYLDYEYNVENYLVPVDPRYKTAFGQVLFSYKLNPTTVLFLGYTDNYFGNNEIDLTRSDRTFFAKVGYNWNL